LNGGFRDGGECKPHRAILTLKRAAVTQQLGHSGVAICCVSVG
jgi:hypothetical protein